jgi:hypothetical protein
MSKYAPRRGQRGKKERRDSTPGPHGPDRIMWTIVDETNHKVFYGPYMNREDAEAAAELTYARKQRDIRIVRMKCKEDLSYPYEPEVEDA